MIKKTIPSLLLMLLFFAQVPGSAQSTYFVDPYGNDEASGLSAGEAWKSLAKLNAQTFLPEIWNTRISLKILKNTFLKMMPYLPERTNGKETI